jgi:hypothetical protein
LQKILARSALTFERDLGGPSSRPVRHDVNFQRRRRTTLES